MCTDEEYTDYSDIGSIHIREGIIPGKKCRMPDSMTEPNLKPLELPFCSGIVNMNGPNDSVQLIPGLTCIDEAFDSNFDKQMDETEVLQCSKYFSRGFSCVLRNNCVSASDNAFVLLKFELDSIFIEEIESNAQCPEKEMICCSLENNKLISDLKEELEFDSKIVTTPMTTITEDVLQCSKYFSRGFSCVSRKNCVSFSGDSFVLLKFELDSIFVEEIESNAQCPEKEMVCCSLENNKLISDLEKEDEFDSNQVTTPMTTFETSKLPPCSKNGPDTNDFIQIPGLTCTDVLFDANFYIESTTVLTKEINVQSRSEDIKS